MFASISSWWGGSPTPAAAPKPFDPTDPKQNPLNPEGLKPCCACPKTKSLRDDCFLKNDASVADEKCKELVQAHIACMRGYGFKV
ncbi:cytochrome C oxidase copper chaperone-domain-containing protein [Cristinia sonorae]|uniref:Cytochrome C oxidase copper chaperone-domain-containing protein n=1 Tax=Cristinia sonorae TaxID=1940300 RepID=A0A8K0UMT4_9AGAR|nr:cytochrome C oxidase copper chaperone-domain-containing protein [Cristinia sonorae]